MTIEPNSTRMFCEAAEAAGVVRTQLKENAATVARIARRLQATPPPFIVTVARGSSDHAACFAKYLFETRTGLFTASAGPSVFSVYKRQMSFANVLCILISQSGASPDLLAAAAAARDAGAFVVAVVNVAESPLAGLADEVLAMHAGPETSVAATKSFIASLSAVIQVTAAWQQDTELARALHCAPQHLEQAWNSSWDEALEPLSKSSDLFVLGRGLGLGIAYEAALKFKEVCALHAEAFSSAEVMHGPVTIARSDFPVLVLAQNDETLPGIRKLTAGLSQRGVKLLTAGLSEPGAVTLPSPATHPAIEPMLRIQSFYRMVNRLSVNLGLDPDQPPFLNKVTETV
jgi:glucosamine--fructose-6-phosphate aminotransferase (isomerizing)